MSADFMAAIKQATINATESKQNEIEETLYEEVDGKKQIKSLSDTEMQALQFELAKYSVMTNVGSNMLKALGDGQKAIARNIG